MEKYRESLRLSGQGSEVKTRADSGQVDVEETRGGPWGPNLPATRQLMGPGPYPGPTRRKGVFHPEPGKQGCRLKCRVPNACQMGHQWRRS